MIQGMLIAGGVLTLALLASLGVNKLQYDHAEELNQVIANERASVQRLNDEIVGQKEVIHTLEMRRAEDQRDIIELGEQAAIAQLEREEAVAHLNEYRDRLDSEALARPAVVSRAATSATRRVFKQFFEASGGVFDASGNARLSSTEASADLPAASVSGGDNP